MSFQYEIPGVGFVANQLIGQAVKDAIGVNVIRGINALDAGNNIEAAQAFSQATAVLLIGVAQTVWMASGSAAISGLGPVFQGLSTNKGIVAKLLEKYGTPLTGC